jgi:hypothetical protein
MIMRSDLLDKNLFAAAFGSYLHYVEGDIPSTVKFRKDFKNDHYLEIINRGGHVIGLPEKWDTVDLEEARAACRDWQDKRR